MGPPSSRVSAQTSARSEVNEIILINSHDGASSYQMLAGTFRFACCNRLVVGEVERVRIPHKVDVESEVIEGAFLVVGDFEGVEASADRYTTHVVPWPPVLGG